MSSTSETGHAKNVANFESLISFCKGYGTTYNPSKPSLTIANLTILQNLAKTGLQLTKTTKAGFDNATNARQTAFKDLKPFSTKVLNALSVSGATALAVADATAINRKIQGAKATVASKAAAKTPGTDAVVLTDKAISSSQQSYDSLIDHFARLIETVTQESKYTPNEAELKIATLQTKLTGLKTANTSLIDGFTKWSNARIQRDSVLYNPLIGLVQTSIEVKKYIKSVFGAVSPQYKQVSSIEFTKVKVK